MIVAISGGFDPIHSGHISHIQEAAKLGSLVVILNDTNFLIKKKGYYFYEDAERVAILSAIKGVERVYLHHPTNPEDMTVSEALEIIQPRIFAKGGDRDPYQLPLPLAELEVCEKLGIEIRYGVDKADCRHIHSSPLVYEIMNRLLQIGGNNA